ncbi:SseB family protein [Micromonospora okii]|uniref:SseB family protein n=1 Tax=Micromonospora okii TaxID=1182970 RepID=UPI001E2922E0|nr:SseB family protein [Micromonospora okii]
MTDWEPATEAEAAMRDALRANDQELYFRILARTELLLPVSAEALSGQAPPGWGTWTTNGRTHVLAFTSPAALRACLGGNPAPSRRSAYAALAAEWPNHEWWLAVNPGLPIEGYLPAWFVSQLSRGDVRLPGRTMGARARLERAESVAKARATAVVAGRDATVASAPGPQDATRGGPPAPVTRPEAVPPEAAPAMTPLRPPAPVDGPLAAPRPDGPTARGPGALGPAGTGAGPADPGPGRQADGLAADPAPGGSGWLNVRRRPPAPPAQPAPADTPVGAARPVDPPGPSAPPNSFFEPASGRNRAARPLGEPRRPAEQAAPPARGFAAGGQAFPRRRPAPEPLAEQQTHAFRPGAPAEPPTTAFPPAQTSPGDTSHAGEPPPAFRPASTGEPPRTSPDQEATRPISLGGGAAAAEVTRPISLGGGAAAAEVTRPISLGGGAAEVTRPISLGGGAAAAEVTRPISLGGGAAAEEATRPIGLGGGPAADEVTRRLGVTGGPASGELPRRGPVPGVAQAFPRPRPGAADEEATRPLPGQPATPVEELTEEAPGALAESAGEPTATRRSFSPIVIEGTVIEGTVIESRELPATQEAIPLGPGASAPPAPEPVVADPVTGTPAAGPDEQVVASAAPAAAEPTMSLFTPAGRPEPDAAADSPFHPTDEASPAPPPAPVATAPTPDPALTPSAEPTTAPGPTTDPDLSTAPESTTDPELDTAPGWGTDPGASTDPGTAAASEPAPDLDPEPEFRAANDVEEELLAAAGAGSTDTFLSTLLLARVLLPVAPDSAPGSRPGEPGFVWRTERLDGETYVVVYTSPERLADHLDEPVETVRVKFARLIRRWPDDAWSFAVNPNTPVGAKLPGEQIVALANWAAEVGLGDDVEAEPEPQPQAVPEASAGASRHVPPPVDPSRPVVMQKTIAPSQLSYYLERGYDRVSGFVHRANELAHLNTPARLHDALGLSYPGSPFSRDAEEIYVLRWPAHRPSLYRIPYGGQNEAAMRAMEGWVIERPPFRGNGFAPGESSDVVAEFKVDSARLPHGAQLWRIGADGTERMVAVLDTDALLWRRRDGGA